MSPRLETHELAVGWRGNTVLRDVNLRLNAGERLALVGLNGCGKSTLLRTLAGLLPPLSGRVLCGGEPLPQGIERVRRAGVLLQDEPASSLSVHAMVELGLGQSGPPDAAAQVQTSRALERAQMLSQQWSHCNRLSGGEKQRVLLARASVCAPDVLLLDEPTNHLDPARAHGLWVALDAARATSAVVVCTHDLSLAASCEKVALLHEGRISDFGTAAAVLTEHNLEAVLQVPVRRCDDPAGGPPFFRLGAPARRLNKSSVGLPPLPQSSDGSPSLPGTEHSQSSASAFQRATASRRAS